MRISRSSSTIVLSIALTAFAWSQSVRIEEILRWQDQRSHADSLVIALRDARPSIRTAAALALANIQDTASVPALVACLRDRDAGVRRTAAFALGQMPAVASERGLLEAIPGERAPDVRRGMMDALGRCGRKEGLDSVVAWTIGRRSSAGESAAAMMRFAIRGVRSVDGIATAFAILKNNDVETRWRALAALGRWAPHRTVDSIASLHGTTLAVLVDDRSPDVRMNLAALLGRTAERGSFILLQEMMAHEPKRKDPDWRVQVNVARALTAAVQRDPSALAMAIQMASMPNVHVKIATLQALEQLPPSVLRDSTAHARLFNCAIRMLDTSAAEPEQVRAEAFVLLGRLNEHELANAEDALQSPESSEWMKTKLLEAYGQQPTKRNLAILLRHLGSPSTRVATAAWDYAHRIVTAPFLRAVAADTAYWRPMLTYITDRAVASLRRNDMAISTVVAGFFSDTALFRWLSDNQLGGILRGALSGALNQMSSDADVEAMQALIGTLGTIGDSTAVPTLERLLSDPDRTVVQAASQALTRIRGGAETVHPAVTPPSHTDYDWALLRRLTKGARADIVTTKGRVEIELLAKDAPFTVLSFVRLVERKFFDGLSFHRVVPNFVVQGGDPRGDGWGGPGYSIRTEVSTRQYERGSVGVASAGKDTEGCQFFITHSATPHLDGRYTIFARVTKGMDVVDRLQISDRIESIRIR